MAGAQWCLLLLFLLFQMAVFGASAPLEPGGGGGGGGGAEEAEAEEEGETTKDDSVFISHALSSTLIKPSDSRKLLPGETSLDSISKTDQTEAKEIQKSTKSKNVEQPVPNSHVQNLELSRHQDNGISQDKARPPQTDSHVSGISHEKSDPQKPEPLPPAADSSQFHTPELDPVAQKPGLNEAEQGEDLPLKPEGPPGVPVPGSLSKKSDPKEVKETPKSLPPHVPVLDSLSKKSDPKEVKETSQNLPPEAHVPDSTSKKSDPKEVKETPQNLLPEAHVLDSLSKKSDPKEVKETPQNLPPEAPVADSFSKKSDPKEVKETQNLPLSVGNSKPAADVPKSPPLKEDQNEANQNGILTTKLKPPQSDETVTESSPEKSVQNGKLPTTVENNQSDTFVPKDEDDEDEGMEEDEMIGDGKVGEEIAGASQSEKEEAKSSPAGPAPKNGSENSHFFAYLVTTAIVVAALYIAYHNKRKIIAFALEGKKSKVIRRPKSSDYQRLDQKI